jgi:hypothetical protein
VGLAAAIKQLGNKDDRKVSFAQEIKLFLIWLSIGAWFILQAKVGERESGNFWDKAGCLLADSLSPNSDLFSLT